MTLAVSRNLLQCLQKKLKMVFHKKLNDYNRALIKVLRLEKGEKVSELSRRFKISERSVIRIIKEEKKPEKRVQKPAGGGRPRVISSRDERQIQRCLLQLRDSEGNFTAKRVKESAGIKNVSLRTISRTLNRLGYGYRQARKKGVITKKDKTKRLRFARKMNKMNKDIWTEDVAFFLDGVAFAYKRNPRDQSRAPKGRVWRKANEGLALGCTAKGKKEGTGGRMLKLFVAISCGKGVIGCNAYDKLDGQFFANYIKNNFEMLFKKAKKRKRYFVQDNDPSQNSGSAKRALRKCKAKQLCIPARSPDLNPIENLFHLVKRELDLQAIQYNITVESFDEFSIRVIRTMNTFSVATIDRLIQSMPKRIALVLQGKGNRIKY